MLATAQIRTATMPALGVPASARELDALSLVIDHDAAAALNLLVAYLNSVQAGTDSSGWAQYAGSVFRRHRLFEKIQNSPFSQRGFHKPRGYAGDPVLMDMVFTPDVVTEKLEGLARWVFIWETGGLGAHALRSRRDVFARTLDEVAAQKAAPRVAAIEAGHARESTLSRAFSTGRFAEFFALGRDKAALATVAANQPGSRIREGTLEQILSGQIPFEGYDLIYVPTLLEMLSAPDAARLTRDLFAKLAPGGRLVLANLTPSFPLRTYFEAALDWWVNYRTIDDLRDSMSLINPNDVAHFNVFASSSGAVAFLNLRRR